MIPNMLFQYEDLIDTFKSVHKELETLRNSGYSTMELRKDIEEMEKEKDTVEKRIERMQHKVEGTVKHRNPNVRFGEPNQIWFSYRMIGFRSFGSFGSFGLASHFIDSI